MEPPSEETGVSTPAGEPALPVPVQKLLPVRLSRFAPPDPVGERRTRERLARMALSALRNRRQRIDQRLSELGRSIGEEALRLPSVRGTGLIDVDRILRKLDRLEEARDHVQLERQARKQEGGLVGSLTAELGWLADVFQAREIRTRRDLLVSELGLALCACDDEALREWAPHVMRLLDDRVADARRVDELFSEARLVDEEFARRTREGQDKEPPKQIELILGKAMDQVDDVGDRLVDLGKSAAKAAVKGGGVTAWTLASGAAKGAWALGRAGLRRAAGDEEDPEPGAEQAIPLPPPDAELLRERAFLDGPSAGAAGAAAGPPSPGAAPPRASSKPPVDPQRIPELIRDLKRLVDEGILDPEEFQRKKAELLARL